MPTPDIRNKLINQSKNSLTESKPLEAALFLPEIPSAASNKVIAPNIIDALEQTKKLNYRNINNERRRIDETTDILKETNLEIDSATKNIQAANSSILLDFQGIFDSQYNRQFQRGRIIEAKRQLEIKDQELTLERQRDALDMKEAGLPLDMFKSTLDLQTKKIKLSTAHANALVSSNTARKALRTMLQSQYSHDKLVTMHKTNSSDEIWSSQELFTYVKDNEKFELDMDVKNIAAASDRVDLAEKVETLALQKVPLPRLRALIQVAEIDKQPAIQMQGITIATDKAQVILSERLKAQQTAFQSTAESQLKLLKNDGEMSQAMSNLESVSTVYTGDGRHLVNLGQLNLLNITEETIKDIPIEAVHPSLRADFQNVLKTATIMNDKTDNKIHVSVEDVHRFKQLVNDLNKKAEDTQKSMLNSTVNKRYKAGLTEWFSEGRMQTQDNSAGVLAANIITTPNLAGDQALSASYQVMIDNISTDIIGDDTDLSNLEPEERLKVKSERLVAAVLDTNFITKPSSVNTIIKALNTKNKDKVTPVDAYIGNRSQEITLQAMQKMAETWPEYADYFESLKTETDGFINRDMLGKMLAELSFKMQEKNPETPDRVLNEGIINFMNDIILKNKNQWDSQLNPIRGSLMNLMFNADPSILVDTALTDSFGTGSRDGWEKVKQITEIQDLSRLNQGFSAAEIELYRNRTQQYGETPLPEIQ